MKGLLQKSLFGEREKELQNKFNALLKYSKVIRDPVHGDIWITKLEKEIVDNIYFQRLRKIRQLGPTYLVYPGANHTRFEHCIGTLHIAQQIMNTINRNYEYTFPDDPTTQFSQYPMIPEDIFITRIVALIHDLAHVSFGHTLEDEGNIFKENKQWKDKKRREEIINQIFPIIYKKTEMEGINKEKINEILKEIEEILIAEEEGEDEIKKLNRPYIADIVGNTICADLLDYLKRDAYYTGLKLTYDPRILSYFVLRDYKEEKAESELTKPRLAILLERRASVLRRDILSDCVDLLKLRYSLAEKIYYHRVKVTFSAMVIKMAYCGIEAKIIDINNLMFGGDDALIYCIANIKETDNANVYMNAARNLAISLQQRRLYKIAYSKITYSARDWSKVSKYQYPINRYRTENKLEQIFELPSGSIIIYAPKRDKGKEAETKIFLRQLDPPVRTLKNLTNEPEFRIIGAEIDTINSRYGHLWQFYVLIDRNYADRILDDVGKVCEDIIERKNIESIVRVRAKMLEEKKAVEISQTTIHQVIKSATFMKDPREIDINFIDEELLKRIKRS